MSYLSNANSSQSSVNASSSGTKKPANQSDGFNYGAAGVKDNDELYTYDKNDPDQYRIHILRRYLGGEGGLDNNVRAYAGGLRPDLARSAIASMQARSAQRTGLNQSIAGMPDQLNEEIGLLRGEASDALKSGTQNTRENFNRRGLLYSGMREGGEQKVRNAVAGTLASGETGARRDYQNTMSARKSALAQLELASAQKSLEQANMAFETTTRNNIARRQAFEQLGEGIGYAGGAYAGRDSWNSKSSATSPLSSSASSNYSLSNSGSNPSLSGSSYFNQPNPFSSEP